jgi:hypothetical protein
MSGKTSSRAVRQGLWVVATPRLSQPSQTSTRAHRIALALSNGAVHVTRLRWILLLMANPRSLMCGGFHRSQNGPTLICGATHAVAMGEPPHWTIFHRYLPVVMAMHHKILRTHLALYHPVMYHLQTRTHTRHHPHSRIRRRRTSPQLLLPLCQQNSQAS